MGTVPIIQQAERLDLVLRHKLRPVNQSSDFNIRVTGNSIFQPDGHVSHDLTPGAPFIIYTKWPHTAMRNCCIYMNIKVCTSS